MLLGLGLKRVGSVSILERLMLGMTKAGVLVQRDLAVKGDDVAVLGEDERVHLDERGILTLINLEQLDEDIGDLRGELVVKTRGLGDLQRPLGGNALNRVDLDPGESLRTLDRELLDLHPTLDTRETQIRTVRAIQQHGEVVLLRDTGTRGHHHPLDDMSLDVEAEDRLRGLVRLIRVLRDLDAAGLAATSGLDLSLHDHDAAEPLSGRPHLIRRIGDDAGEHRNPILLEQITCLVLVQIHGQSFAERNGRRM